MPGLESQIDELYAKPLAEFVAARTALARTLDKEQARRVKTLPKPTVVPWTVNQIYWHARDQFDRLMHVGGALRQAQVAALAGRKGADVRQATEDHRAAIARAASTGIRLAADAGANPDTDDLSRTLEALSLSGGGPERPGRLTKPLAPAGFEALAGITVKALPRPAVVAFPTGAPSRSSRDQRPPPDPAPRAKVAAHAAKEAREREAAERKQLEVIRRAEADVTRAQAAETAAREAWQQARDRRVEAERKLAELER